jgi:hypothetical protein
MDANTERTEDTAVTPTCPNCGGSKFTEVFRTWIVYPVSGIRDGEAETGEALGTSDGEFDFFECSGCHYGSEQIDDLVAPDPGFEPSFTRRRRGGWYVHGVVHPDGAVGCVSDQHPDGRWRIVSDSRDGDHSYESRDEAARAEYALTRAGVIA